MSASGFPADSVMIWERSAGALPRSASSREESSKFSRESCSSGMPGATKPSSRPASTIATPSAASRMGGEQQGLGGGLVQPLGVVDQTEQRPVLGEVREDREHREPGEEAVGSALLVSRAEHRP